MEAKVGDLVEVESERVGKPMRQGTVLEILSPGPDVHYRIRWVDGHETILFPLAGSMSVVGEGAKVSAT
ncbi:MAG: DUF1918 domain-containing protein [Candidatus Dormibacteraeota bacterium]|nr:DUF1918 domain-containing protein [Candidatus Dormibacteraeota bacterium]